MKKLKIAVTGILPLFGENRQRKSISEILRKECAQDFAESADKKGYQTISFDLPEHGERTDGNYRCDIWNGIHDLNVITDYVFSKWNQVALIPRKQ